MGQDVEARQDGRQDVSRREISDRKKVSRKGAKESTQATSSIQQLGVLPLRLCASFFFFE
jgi:hypothetical protein